MKITNMQIAIGLIGCYFLYKHFKKPEAEKPRLQLPTAGQSATLVQPGFIKEFYVTRVSGFNDNQVLGGY